MTILKSHTIGGVIGIVSILAALSPSAQTQSASRVTNLTKPFSGRPIGTVTYSRDIAPVLYKNCTPCHRNGEVGPFALQTYTDARKRAAQIALVVAHRSMPPWKLESHGEFQNERRLSDEQIGMIEQWAEAGAPEGNKAQLPLPPQFPVGWTLGEPDLILQPSAVYNVAAEGRDVYRCFVIRTHFDEDLYVSALDVHPGNRRVVHHVLAYIDTQNRARRLDGQEVEPGYSTGGGIGFLPDGMLGGWAPGAQPIRLPEETGILLPKGADVVLEVHYHKDGKPETDRSEVALYFNKGRIDKPLHILPLANLGIRIPAGVRHHEEKVGIPIPLGATLYTVFPHMHNLGTDMTVTATLPDGTKKQLAHVPDWDFNWQGFYGYKEPVKLPQGSKIDLVAHYDNSAGNPRNPNQPPKEVRWGEQTTDEMCLCYLGFTLNVEHLPKKSGSSEAKQALHGRRTADGKEPSSVKPTHIETRSLGQADPFAAAKGKKALVLFFIGTDCPISNAYAPEIRRICERYTRQSIDFALVYPDPGLSLVDAERHAKEYGYNCSVFLDPGHRLTRRAGATITPQVAVFAQEGKRLYRGRIDNLYVDFGKPRYEATQHDLDVALDAVVHGKDVPHKFTKAIGCFIPGQR